MSENRQAYRNGTLVAPTHEYPTFWNKDAALGFLLFNLLGMIVGGFIGKHRMERDLAQSKEVRPPHFWNKSAAIGGLLGMDAASLVVYFAMEAAGVATLGGPVALAIVAGIAACAIIGTIIGGKSGERKMATEYAAAQEYQRQHGQEMQLGRGLCRQIDSDAPDLHDMGRSDGKAWTSEANRAGEVALGGRN